MKNVRIQQAKHHQNLFCSLHLTIITRKLDATAEIIAGTKKMIYTMNIITPAEGKKEQVQEMLSHLVSEVEKNETGALMFCASWIEDVGVFYLIEGFANEAAQDHHRNQPYTAELHRIWQEEQNLAKKVEVFEMGRFAGFTR
ncbi:hypothetical protein PGQ11_009239 [Apiospora arundinis]|uniref:ABM domain-containing protein n=1 Tax=Apiospora arundinis TaxID=335852 RepID=A0ABR2II69_9PEZI